IGAQRAGVSGRTLQPPVPVPLPPRHPSDDSSGTHFRRESMNVEYTGRQFEVTPLTRKQVEGGLEKIQKILGSNFDTHVILSTEKRRHIAEITITVRNHAPIVGLSEAMEMSTAIGGALDRIERHAVKYKTRWKSKKRQARKKLELVGESLREPSVAIAVGG